MPEHQALNNIRMASAQRKALSMARSNEYEEQAAQMDTRMKQETSAAGVVNGTLTQMFGTFDDYIANSIAGKVKAVEVAKSVVGGGVRDAVQQTGEKLVDLGAKAVAGYGSTALAQQGFAPDKIDAARTQIEQDVHDTLQFQLPEVQKVTDSFGEDMARSMVSFFSAYGPVFKAITRPGEVVAGVTEGMTLGAKFMTRLKSNISQMPADAIASATAGIFAFENKEGTFGDLAIQLGLDNEFTQFMSGELADNEWEASLKAGLADVGLTSMFWLVGPWAHLLREGIPQAYQASARVGLERPFTRSELQSGMVRLAINKNDLPLGYRIVDQQTGKQVGKTYMATEKSPIDRVAKRVSKRVDKLDNEYGAVRYARKPIYRDVK